MIHLGTSRDEWQHPEEIVAALKLEAGQTVADIEAGTGYMVAHLSEAVGGNGTVIAIDAEAAMIEYLANHLPELGPAHIVTQKVDFHDPELKPESVHGVLTLDTWHHMSEREAYARKVYDGLRKGERFAITPAIKTPIPFFCSIRWIERIIKSYFSVSVADRNLARET
ncbi:class I SAM-dependent methyltransferase [Roseiconus lacunae]|uniref:class I SAM-dependent methyltransferase n=1 Tax=Roseiconus lacunae TaxID=2605694 RepID=UPI00190F164E|nr:class I SAM-dependent methyltransferase [Roseiconus lacunae]